LIVGVLNSSIALGKEICLIDLIIARDTPINTVTRQIDPLLTLVSLSLAVNTVVETLILANSA
jgi:hypothetical protein